MAVEVGCNPLFCNGNYAVQLVLILHLFPCVSLVLPVVSLLFPCCFPANLVVIVYRFLFVQCSLFNLGGIVQTLLEHTYSNQNLKWPNTKKAPQLTIPKACVEVEQLLTIVTKLVIVYNLI